MSKQDRKAALAAYKEASKPIAGIYAVRCVPTGEIWVGESRNLAAQETSLRFALRQDSHPNRPMLDAHRQHPDGFTFEILEELSEDETGTLQRAALRTKSTAWIDQLGARRL